MRQIVAVLVAAVALAACLETNDTTSLYYRISIAEELDLNTVTISESDADRINSPVNEFVVRSSAFRIATSDQLSEHDSIEFCFDDPILAATAGGQQIEIAPSGTCILSWGTSKIPE